MITMPSYIIFSITENSRWYLRAIDVNSKNDQLLAKMWVLMTFFHIYLFDLTNEHIYFADITTQTDAACNRLEED